MSATLWYTIFLITYILCLIVLTHWKEIEGLIYSEEQLKQQLRARPEEAGPT